jgi:nicotinamide mononucleotide transporter
MVVLNMRMNPWAWPLAITSSLLYGLLFWSTKLYGDAALQSFFVVVALWGWWQWLQPTTTQPIYTIRQLSNRGRAWLLAALALTWPATGLFLKTYTDTDVPWWDAFPTAASVLGQWLLGRKYIENWWVWVVVNTVSVALFAYKGLWLTVLLYGVFIVLSLLGWRAWRRLQITHQLVIRPSGV